MNFRLLLSYDGTAYFGWQKTEKGPTIQETLAKALYVLSPNSSLPEAASRTDKGVHAEGQVVSFSLPHDKPIAPHTLQKALNAHLPADIRVLNVESVPDTFHPTLDAKKKEYRYRICLSGIQNPIYRLYSWSFRYLLKIEKMECAAQALIGTHDFSALANETEKNPICTIETIEIAQLAENRLEIAIRGDRFLYKMMRNLVGTLLYIGSGKLPDGCIQTLLASKDRKEAGMTAPAHGLTLSKVFY